MLVAMLDFPLWTLCVPAYRRPMHTCVPPQGLAPSQSIYPVVNVTLPDRAASELGCFATPYSNSSPRLRAALAADSRGAIACLTMIRAHGSPRRALAFTEDQLEELAAEFAEYAALDIADLLQIDASSP